MTVIMKYSMNFSEIAKQITSKADRIKGPGYLLISLTLTPFENVILSLEIDVIGLKSHTNCAISWFVLNSEKKHRNLRYI